MMARGSSYIAFMGWASASASASAACGYIDRSLVTDDRSRVASSIALDLLCTGNVCTGLVVDFDQWLMYVLKSMSEEVLR
jgi:hypothetical protein